MTPRVSRIRSAAALALPLALGAVLIAVAPWAALREAVAAASGATLGAVFLLLAASHGLRAGRLYALLGRPPGQWRVVLDISLAHTAWNHLLPARAGELALPLLLRQRLGHRWQEGAGLLVVLRALDAALLLGLATLVLLPLPPALKGFLLAAGAALLVAALGRAPRWLGRLPARWRPVLDWPSDWRFNAAQVLYTALGWSAKLAALWMLGQGLDAAAAVRMAAITAGELSSVLPVHGVAGLGTYEAAFVAPLVAAGVALEAALVHALLAHAALLFTSLLLAGLSPLTLRLWPVCHGAATEPR